MKKIISIATIFFQIFSAFVVLFIIYIIFALLDMTDYDFANAAGFLIFQPIFGLLFCVATIAACLFVGLPIRLIQGLYNWWIKKPYIIFLGVIVRMVLLIISLIFTEARNIIIDGRTKSKANSKYHISIDRLVLNSILLTSLLSIDNNKLNQTKLFSRRLEQLNRPHTS